MCTGTYVLEEINCQWRHPMEDEREDIIRDFHTEEDNSVEEIEVGTKGGSVHPPEHETDVAEREGLVGEIGVSEKEAEPEGVREGITGRLAGEYEEEETYTETPGLDEEYTTSSHNEEHHEHLSE
jgi:hypothetical protein